jgi:hypothetical protein
MFLSIGLLLLLSFCDSERSGGGAFFMGGEEGRKGIKEGREGGY